MIAESTHHSEAAPNIRNLEQELYACDWICAKCHEDYYAQNLYASMCNMRWQPIETFAILKDEYWTISWRGSGGVVANIRNKMHAQPDGISQTEDYMDWYCSGLTDGYDSSEKSGYVEEGIVTPEIAQDLAKLGWRPVPYVD